MENWPELLRSLGPFALLPFVLLFIERLAWKRAHDNKLPEAVRNRVYSTAWIMIFVLCGLVVFFWYLSLPAPKEAVILGKVTGLGPLNMFRGSGPEAANVRVFTYRDPQQTDQLFWRIFSADPLADSTSLAFLVDNTTQNSEETLRFRFLTKKQYYDPLMVLDFVFDPEKRQLTLMNAVSGEPEILKGEPVVVDVLPASPGLLRLPWFGTVWAQTKSKVGVTIANLESSDPLVRLTARKQLASLGPEALMEMNRVLSAPGATYRMKLGVIVAANQMTGFRQEGFGLPAWCEVWKSSLTGDDTLKGQANLLLRKRSPSLNAQQCNSPQRPAPVAPARGGH
jgi:hypothetical protein